MSRGNGQPGREPEGDVLDIEQAAALLGVSVKTFNKVLHSQDMPARKIGREWKFSRQALIDWVGSGRSSDYYKDGAAGARRAGREAPAQGRARRTAGWNIEY